MRKIFRLCLFCFVLVGIFGACSPETPELSDDVDASDQSGARAQINHYKGNLWEFSANYATYAEENEAALEILVRDNSGAVVRPEIRSFFRGYVSFRVGEAEDAAEAFTEARKRFFCAEFPYRGDPVLYVQSLFYLGETALATGDEPAAVSHYRSFLDYWETADWNIQAVERAREKLENLTSSVSTP